MIRISKQEWRNISDYDLIRYVILDERGASVILEIYNNSSEDGYGCRAFMWGLWVDKQIRHRGIGQELLDKCIDLTICNGIDALFIEYEKVNHPWILQWYKRNGFMVLAKNKNKCLMKKQIQVR